jgi:branched-chain amino acid transport system substrate-binding protein
VCVQQPAPHCVALPSVDCTTVTGDYSDDGAIVIGSLLATGGPQASTGLARQDSVILAVEEIAATGGIPGPMGTQPRPLVLLSCDEAADVLRAARHLVDDLHVPAIVGPSDSHNTIEVSDQVSAAGGTVLLTPTGAAAAIADLADDNLTYQMVPSDAQRQAPLLQQINTVEAQLRAARSRETIRLAIVFREDPVGAGTRQALEALSLNGVPLADALRDGAARADAYDPGRAEQGELVAAVAAFQPDLVVLAGAGELVGGVLQPLEAQWPAGAPRPFYIGIESVKVAELLAAVAGADNLRTRIRGTGVTAGSEAAAVASSFVRAYQVRYPGKPTAFPGMGAAYDSVYAIAFALAASRDLPVTGLNLSTGLPRLSGGANLALGPTTILSAFQQLVAGGRINAIGTQGVLEWTAPGAKAGGTVDIWCIAGGASPSFQSSGLSYDVKTQTYAGTFAQCAP